MRRDSCRSVPMMRRPPAARTISRSAAQERSASASASAYVAASTSAGLSPRTRSASDASPAGLPPSTMSVPRPAMLVAIVTAPLRPACATTGASRSCCFAFKTLWGIPSRLSNVARCSERSTDVVPTSTGWPAAIRSLMCSTMAPSFARSVR